MADIYIAKIGKTVGLKGQLKLHIDTDFPEQFKKNSIFITHKKQSLTIESFNYTSKVVKFVEINSIEDAQKYINSQLLTSKKETVKNCILKEKQFFWFDLMGCTITENSTVLGTIKDIHRYPIDDYFEITTNQDLLKENDKLAKTFLLPYNDTYIKNVDIFNKEIIVLSAKDILEAS